MPVFCVFDGTGDLALCLAGDQNYETNDSLATVTCRGK